MLCINLPTTDPYINLAVEEILLRKKKEDYLVIYVNSPSAIIGKHQVAHRETDTEFVTKNKIPVIRRISGGGTVYHDPGNLNFTFILQSKSGSQVDFRKYTKPVIEFLNSAGIDARFEGKNDLKVNGLKISGNAEHIYRERVLHHGTILFDTDIAMMKKSIRNNTSLYLTRGVASNPSPVINLKQLLPDINTMNDFREKMYCYFINRPENESTGLTPEDLSEAEYVAASKFSTWEWNYAYGPDYHFHNSFEINHEESSCKMFVRNGIITECEIDGSMELHKAANKLIGSRHMPEDIKDILLNEGMPENEIFQFF